MVEEESFHCRILHWPAASDEAVSAVLSSRNHPPAIFAGITFSCKRNVLSGLNNLTGPTGTARTATLADFSFPVAPKPGKPSSGKSSGKRRRIDPASETYQLDEDAEQEKQDEEEDYLVFQQSADTNDSSEITIKHNVQLKKLAIQCFCGKSSFKTPAEVERHRLAVHTGHGKGINPKRKRQRDY